MWFAPLLEIAIPAALGLFALACDKPSPSNHRSKGSTSGGPDRYIPRPKLAFSETEPANWVYDQLSSAGVEDWRMDRGWDLQKEFSGNGIIEVEELKQTTLDFFNKEPNNPAYKKILEETMPKASLQYYTHALEARAESLGRLGEVCSTPEMINYYKSVVFDEKNLQPYEGLGSCLQQPDFFLYIIFQRPDYRPAYIGLSKVLVNQENLDEELLQLALDALLTADAMGPPDPEVFKLLGVAYQKMGNDRESLYNFLRSFYLDPSQTELLPSIEALVNQEVLTPPKTPMDFYFHSIYFHFKGKRFKSIALLNRAIRLDPEFVLGHEILRNLYLEDGHPEKARRHDDKVKEIRKKQEKTLQGKMEEFRKKLDSDKLPPMEIPPGISH